MATLAHEASTTVALEVGLDVVGRLGLFPRDRALRTAAAEAVAIQLSERVSAKRVLLGSGSEGQEPITEAMEASLIEVTINELIDEFTAAARFLRFVEENQADIVEGS